jgi:tRNA 2-selenouridine synthase
MIWRLAMFKNINFSDLNDRHILIDVRSPSEYKEATIPGAINIPIFDDEERKVIGYTYVNESVDKAKKLGVEAVSKKLPRIYDEFLELDKKHDRLVLFCARGGMRSSSLCSLLTSLGMDTYKLNNGYKGYRKFINDELPRLNNEIKYIVLHGTTGVGKTEILKHLIERGHDVLDLEEAANHRGSLLGSVGLGEPNSQKQFEALVFEVLRDRKANYVFVEGESKRIGNIVIPSFIYKSMEKGVHILVDADLNFRTKLIIEEYTNHSSSEDEILLALEALSKYISSKNIEKYKELTIKGEYETVVEELMVKYYDPMYLNGINKYEYDYKLKVDNIERACELIEAWVEQYKQKEVK